MIFRRKRGVLELLGWLLLATAMAEWCLAQATRPAGRRRADDRPAVGQRAAASMPAASLDFRVPPGVKALRDIEYARPNNHSLRLDLYLPQQASQKPSPLVVWIHGGGWRAGSKERCRALPLTAHGYAVASINYRLSTEAVFPAQIEDCKSAIRWLRAHAKQYQLDPERFGAWGSSAGGHLASLLGTSGDVTDLEGAGPHREVSSRVQAVCNWYGVATLVNVDEAPKEKAPPTTQENVMRERRREMIGLLLGGPLAEKRDLARRASPVTYVSKDDPPFLIMHGDKDPLVPINQSEILHDVLTNAGVPVRFEIVRGAAHGTGFGSREMRIVQDFFDRALKPAAATPTRGTTDEPR